MKRENLEIKKENKISENFSEISFSNKIQKRENTKMNFEISRKIVVNNIEFENEENAEKYILTQIFKNNSIEELLEKEEESQKFIFLFNKYRKKKNEIIIKEKREYSNIEKPNIISIKILLKNYNYNFQRNSQEWPVYKFQSITNPEIFFVIRNTKKVYELFYEIQENIENLENFFSKYKYKEKLSIWKEE